MYYYGSISVLLYIIGYYCYLLTSFPLKGLIFYLDKFIYERNLVTTINEKPVSLAKIENKLKNKYNSQTMLLRVS